MDFSFNSLPNDALQWALAGFCVPLPGQFSEFPVEDSDPSLPVEYISPEDGLTFQSTDLSVASGTTIPDYFANTEAGWSVNPCAMPSELPLAATGGVYQNDPMTAAAAPEEAAQTWGPALFPDHPMPVGAMYQMESMLADHAVVEPQHSMWEDISPFSNHRAALTTSEPMELVSEEILKPHAEHSTTSETKELAATSRKGKHSARKEPQKRKRETPLQFVTFDGKEFSDRKRARLTEEEHQNMLEVRAKGACSRCQIRKIRVSSCFTTTKKALLRLVIVLGWTTLPSMQYSQSTSAWIQDMAVDTMRKACIRRLEHFRFG
jgi:hypothetical protein